MLPKKSTQLPLHNLIYFFMWKGLWARASSQVSSGFFQSQLWPAWADKLDCHPDSFASTRETFSMLLKPSRLHPLIFLFSTTIWHLAATFQAFSSMYCLWVTLSPLLFFRIKDFFFANWVVKRCFIFISCVQSSK